MDTVFIGSRAREKGRTGGLVGSRAREKGRTGTGRFKS